MGFLDLVDKGNQKWDNIVTGQNGQMTQNPGRERSMGLLNELALRQEEYRVHIKELRETPDRTYAEAVIASDGMDEDQLIAAATVLFELSADPHRETSPNDILWAQEFIDHLDTLGYQLRRKPDAVLAGRESTEEEKPSSRRW